MLNNKEIRVVHWLFAALKLTAQPAKRLEFSFLNRLNGLHSPFFEVGVDAPVNVAAPALTEDFVKNEATNKIT